MVGMKAKLRRETLRRDRDWSMVKAAVTYEWMGTSRSWSVRPLRPSTISPFVHRVISKVFYQLAVIHGNTNQLPFAPRSLYLSHPFSFHALGNDYHG
jgi:hypothetical protein